jgi:translation elongation factor EF-1alpha
MYHSKVKFPPVPITNNLQCILDIVEAGPGDNVGFNVKGLSVKELKRGYVVSDVKDEPAQESASFVAQVRFFSFGFEYSLYFIAIRLLFSIILVKSVQVMLQFLIVTQLILHANLLNYLKKLIVDQVKQSKKHQNS